MVLETKSFPKGADIPRKLTCDGGDVSPQLAWSSAPAETQSFALIADDPDAPSGTFTHWIAYDIPASTHELPEGAGKSEKLPDGGAQGRNDFRKTGYGGPCPPPGKPHRYFFKLFALNSKLNLKSGISRRELEQAMSGHVIAQAEVMGKYAR